MSLTKKDPSLRVAATDPHLVSLGGGRLSTAVTIHYIQIGDTTIGSSTACSISLNGSGVHPVHCTIYRSENNQVTIVPEQNARILIDGTKIEEETNLTQGAMITIGNSNYLRFNNPDEAMMMRSAMGSNERISMPQIDFTQVSSSPAAAAAAASSSSLQNMQHPDDQVDPLEALEVESFYECLIDPVKGGGGGGDTGGCGAADGIYKQNMSSFSQQKTEQNLKQFASPPIDINGIQCPKVFTAGLVTVNMPAKDVLGQKYASFAKNLAENHRHEKNFMNNALKNNQQLSSSKQLAGNAHASNTHIPSTSNYSYIQNTPTATSTPVSLAKIKSTSAAASSSSNSDQLLAKVNNITTMRSAAAMQPHSYANNVNANAYDRYPKPGTYGGLQIYPMNGVNTEINNGLSTQLHHVAQSNQAEMERERLEDMLKICTEYADRQNQSAANISGSNNSSITSSPIVQNRIKTNGSLPREKKSPFHHDPSNNQLQQWYSGSSGNLAVKPTAANISAYSSSSGYENVRLLGPNRVEINGQMAGGNNVNATTASISSSPSASKSGYENVSVLVGKYVPQSPRTKIRTTCMSPKKDSSYSAANSSFGLTSPLPPILAQPTIPRPATKQREYEQLIKSFERQLQLEMQAIEENSRNQGNSSSSSNMSASSTPSKRTNKNINNLTLQLTETHSLQNSPKPNKKPTPAPRLLNSKLDFGSSHSLTRQLEPAAATSATTNGTEQVTYQPQELKRKRHEIAAHIKHLKSEIGKLQLHAGDDSSQQQPQDNQTGEELQQKLQTLQNKIHRLEAQRNATRVMEENQQAKLKQSIEMKQDQVKKLKAMLKQKPNNECLKDELEHVCESLESDRKTFEDLEFQYFEEESEFHACYEELKKAEKRLILENELKLCVERFNMIKAQMTDADADDDDNDDDDVNDNVMNEDEKQPTNTSARDLVGANTTPIRVLEKPLSNLINGVMSQSLFGSAELLCPKRSSEDIMSKSVNENMFFNHKIELPRVETSNVISIASTPKRAQLLQVFDIDVDNSKTQSQPGKQQQQQQQSVKDDHHIPFNLSLIGERFTINTLEHRVPSQDDIDRSCKVASDAPMATTSGPNAKIFESIMEIERNRKLLLAQQGHHVIEHERQKMYDLKKKSHVEARNQYLQQLSTISSSNKEDSTDKVPNASNGEKQQEGKELQRQNGTSSDGAAPEKSEEQEQQKTLLNKINNKEKNDLIENGSPKKTATTSNVENNKQQRHSQPELEHHAHGGGGGSGGNGVSGLQARSPRPLSDANSERNCELLAASASASASTPQLPQCNKSQMHLAEKNSNSTLSINLGGTGTGSPLGSGNSDVDRRASTNSNETTSAGSGSSNERKRALPKHQRPLTRYLPIFSPDLNLRQHIESAGHQIDLCPHVFVDTNSCRGYLHKLGATFHAWSRRWFVLDRQRSALIYYSDKSERKPRGGAFFSTIDEVYLDHLNASKSGRPHCTFIVKTKKRSYNLQAASDAAARIWIDAIITGAQGNLDY